MSDTLKAPPLWKIWSNPIFVRYARARLRPKSLLPWILVVLVGCAFLFSLIFAIAHQNGIPSHIAANDAFFPILIIQLVILLLMGTGSVASGITREADEGMIDYQRLTPMSPWAKIIGYLFGLPVREYVLFACTLPFSAYCISAGTLQSRSALLIYSILLVSAILYHLTGCVAGSVVKKRRLVGRASQILVVLLYFALPQLGEFLGVVFFEYLTLRPVIYEQISEIRDQMFVMREFFPSTNPIRVVQFFGMEFTRPEFSLLIQGSLVATFGLILFRKWRQATHHLLGKNVAVLLYTYIILMMLGTTLPTMSSWETFPKLGLGAKGEKIDIRAAFVVSAMFGAGALFLSFGFIGSITPTHDKFNKGLLRTRKLGGGRIPMHSDGASAIWHVLAIGVVASIAWSAFAYRVFNSDHVATTPHNESLLKVIPACLILYMICFHGVLERFGRRALMMFVLIFWIVPILIGIVVIAAGIREIPILLSGLSAFAAPFYVLVLPLEGDNLSHTNELIQIGAIFGLFVHLVLASFLAWSLFRHKRRAHRRVQNLPLPHSKAAETR